MAKQTAVEWLIEMISPYITDERANPFIEQAKQMEKEQTEISDAGKDTADYIDRHIIESMKELAIEGFKPQKHMATRVKVTYVAILEGRPIVSASTFDDLRKGLDDYYDVDRTDAECLGFVPYDTKYPDVYEGHYTYSYPSYDEKTTELDVVKVYCIDYFPHTKYEI